MKYRYLYALIGFRLITGFFCFPPHVRANTRESHPIPQILILFPEDEATFNTNSIKIAATLVDPDSLFAPQSIRIILDSQVLQVPVNLQLPLITGSLHNLKTGRHSIQLSVSDHSGNNQIQSPLYHIFIGSGRIEIRNLFQFHWHIFFDE